MKSEVAINVIELTDVHTIVEKREQDIFKSESSLWCSTVKAMNMGSTLT